MARIGWSATCDKDSLRVYSFAKISFSLITIPHISHIRIQILDVICHVYTIICCIEYYSGFGVIQIGTSKLRTTFPTTLEENQS